jgi:hypothetical protein
MRRKRGMLLLMIALASCLLSCGQEPQEAEDASFRLEVEAPETVKPGEPWSAQGILLNMSSRDVEIMHGADLFQYQLYNADNELVPRPEQMIAINDIGYVTTLQHNVRYAFDGSEHISAKLNEWKLAEPGRYTLRVKASFTMEPNRQRVEVAAEPTIIIVEE